MKIVVGLGNPGRRYAATRHNIGARIVDRFAVDRGFALSEHRFESRFGLGQIPSKAAGPPEGSAKGPTEGLAEGPTDGPRLDVALLVPETYMNRSGSAVAEALSSLSVEDILEVRIRPRGSSAGHRGLEDIAERIGSSDFPRLRFGIGRPEAEISAVDWVLDAFSNAEEVALEERIPLAAEAVGSILIDGVVPSMNRYNRGSDAGE